jgi:predicted kinase
VTGVFLHVDGPAPPGMRARELAQPGAVAEVLRPGDLPRLRAALRAEAHRPVAGRDVPVSDVDGPLLVVLVGPPGSGKSSWARRHFRRTEVLSREALRGWVCDDECDQDATADASAVLYLLAAARLARGLRTVVDGTNTTRAARAPLVGMAVRHGVDAYAVVVTTALRVCLARNAARPAAPRPGGRWARRVPEHVVRAQHAATAACAPALAGEGFARVDLLDLAGGEVPGDAAGR